MLAEHFDWSLCLSHLWWPSKVQKLSKTHERISKILKIYSEPLKLPEYELITLSEIGENLFWNFEKYRKFHDFSKSEKMSKSKIWQNPRQISQNSKSKIYNAQAVESWAPNSSWARRNLILKKKVKKVIFSENYVTFPRKILLYFAAGLMCEFYNIFSTQKKVLKN